MEVAAANADPLQRKEKRGLDFSKWREVVKKDATSTFNEKEEGRHSNETKLASNGLSRQIADRCDAKLQSVTLSNNVSTIKEDAKEFHSFRYGKNENDVQAVQYQQDGTAESEGSTGTEEVSTWQNGSSKEVGMKRESMQRPYASSGFSTQTLVGGEENSLQSEIDAENRARLASMSADEFAEAKAEILAKLNPKLISALKKRGEAKCKRQKSSLTDVTGSASDGMQHEEALSKSSEKTVSHEPMEIVTEDAQKTKDGNVSLILSPDKSSIWGAWSKRVERVRDVRFSLDGSIIGFGMELDIGKCTTELHM